MFAVACSSDSGTGPTNVQRERLGQQLDSVRLASNDQFRAGLLENMLHVLALGGQIDTVTISLNGIARRHPTLAATFVQTVTGRPIDSTYVIYAWQGDALDTLRVRPARGPGKGRRLWDSAGRYGSLCFGCGGYRPVLVFGCVWYVHELADANTLGRQSARRNRVPTRDDLGVVVGAPAIYGRVDDRHSAATVGQGCAPGIQRRMSPKCSVSDCICNAEELGDIRISMSAAPIAAVRRS
jgi:hypothetical protein